MSTVATTAVTSQKDAEKVSLTSLPKHGDYEAWGIAARAAIVSAFADFGIAETYLEDLDGTNLDADANCDKSFTNRTSRMVGIDAILKMVTGRDEGSRRLHQTIKTKCKEFCGRQAFAIIDLNYEFHSARKTEGDIQSLVAIKLEGGLNGMDAFLRKWKTIIDDLRGTSDLPGYFGYVRIID